MDPITIVKDTATFKRRVYSKSSEALIIQDCLIQAIEAPVGD